MKMAYELTIEFDDSQRRSGAQGKGKHLFVGGLETIHNANSYRRVFTHHFFDCTRDYVMECLPGCSGAGNPPRHGPTTYAEYMAWFAGQNYAHVRDRVGASEASPDA